MSGILIAESGSTKTDWCLLQSGKRKQQFKTSGINPKLQSADSIAAILEGELGDKVRKAELKKLYFYGAGASGKNNVTSLKKVLSQTFSTRNISVDGDLTAAARGLCGNEKGVICILGTGSNSCYWDGKKIKSQHTSLGYIAGDEGSGNHMGKRILQYYTYHTFDSELTAVFEQLFGNRLDEIVETLYKQPFPNRYLASFVKLLTTNRGHYMVENIVEDCLYEFFNNQILKYRESWKYPIHFTGSIAYEFKDVLQSLCEQYELELGHIVQSPLEGLISFHKESL